MVAELAHDQSNDEFNSILRAVVQTPKGRAFLEEFARRNRNADTQQVLRAIQKLNAAAAPEVVPPTIDFLRRELQEMSASIMQTRAEIAAIKPTEASDNRIMAATEELDAIVTATERATSDILGAAERIQEIAEKIREQDGDGELCDELDSHATNIFMACSFQDITGQRTTKVVQVLRYLEQRVNSMISIWGVKDADGADAPAPDMGDTRPDAHLLNGPQMDGDGVSQDQIDAMLDGFDIASVEDEPAMEAAPAPQGETDAPAATASAEAPEPAPDDDAGEAIDQDDIDALFS